ncbi:MAG: hypothetical protein FRX49_04267 [Trebouxia sp. A1-2]|nr:MAG: hypothetical protein FRX49_04267 [Trebouxia sp. A1-2]
MANSFLSWKHKTSSALLRLAQLRVPILGDLQHLFQPAHIGQDIGISSAGMQEQLEAKAWEANSLTDKKEFVAAAVLATQPVALAENCRSGASQRKILIEFHEFVEQIAQDGRKWLAGSLAQSGSSDAGNAAVLLLRLGKAKHVLGDLEGALKDLCSGNQAQPRKKCSPASIRQDQAGVARWHKQQGGKVANLEFLVKDFRGEAADLMTAEHLQPCDAALPAAAWQSQNGAV